MSVKFAENQFKNLIYIVVISACIAAYLLGAFSDRHNVFPMPQLTALREHFRPAGFKPESRYLFDNQERLIGDEKRPAVPCPKQTNRTEVLLVLGQSNAANYAGQRYRSNFGEKIVNFFDGQCFIAASPLLGSTGTKGEYWTELANKLIASQKVDNVVIVPIAYSGSAVALWAAGGKFNDVMVATVGALKTAGYQPTRVMWDQGEYDYVLGTTEKTYSERLTSVIDTLRGQGVSAPFYVSIASKCLEPSNGGFKEDVADNPVVRAQLALSSGAGGIRRGVNTDALLGEDDRYDDCHIGGAGAAKVASAWADILLNNH
ncbi:sialate O-acetylesterase [Methylobacterium sp. C25]|uniref:sialate O-acetylesterase n=1 Tax=Methylobacterium sp. C25 TaxID=2721622 RepID=UPI001F2DCE01|nr:sialate O-acetylesterase [Methylobacterium sp. C25]MCE4222568.1 sialate O-acetylesterase [Methylobacterium sp. C25]